MTWNEVLMYIINTVFKLIITVGIPYGFNLIRVKLKDDIQKKYLNMFEKMTRDAVDRVQQTYVENLKAEDMFNEEAQKHAVEMVKNDVLNMMNAEMKNVVMEAVGDFEAYITNLIESQVYNNKLGMTYLAEAE